MEVNPTEATQAVIEIIEEVNYTETLNNILAFTNLTADASVLIAGLLLFIVVVIICFFAYKFFRIFF